MPARRVTKNIFVLGIPSSGKSTAINYLRRQFYSDGYRVQLIDDNQILRSLCPVSSKGRGYFYRNGRLILNGRFRDQILNKLQKNLIQQFWQSQGSCDYCLVEFTSPSWGDIVSLMLKNRSVWHAQLVYIETSLRLCLARNRERKPASIVPREYLNGFKKENLNAQLAGLKGRLQKTFVLSNNGSLSQFTGDLNKVYRRLV